MTAAMLISAASAFPRSGQEPNSPIFSSRSSVRQSIARLIESGQLQQAQTQLNQQLSHQGESPDTLYLEALLLFKQKQHEKSEEKLKRSLSIEKDDPEACLLLARNAVLLNQMELAETSLKTSIRLAPKEPLSHLHLGLLYFTTNRFSLAESEFQALVSLDATYMKGYDLLGLAQEELQGAEVVKATYQKAIDLAEKQHLHDESPYLHLAKFLWRKNSFPESLPLAQRAVEVNPQSSGAYYVLGLVLDKLGQTEPAIKNLQESTRIDPQNVEAHYLLSRIYLKQGKQEEARKELQLFRESKKTVKASP